MAPTKTTKTSVKVKKEEPAATRAKAIRKHGRAKKEKDVEPAASDEVVRGGEAGLKTLSVAHAKFDQEIANEKAQLEFSVSSSASNFKDFTRGIWTHILVYVAACTKYYVWDWRWASAKYNDYKYTDDAESRQLLPMGNYNSGMMTERMSNEKIAWFRAVQSIFDGAKMSVDCNAKTQCIVFTFEKKVVPRKEDCKNLLRAFNAYLLTCDFQIDGRPMERTDTGKEGIIQLRMGKYQGKVQKQQIVSCFIGFPDPPDVDDVYVVKPVKVLVEKQQRFVKPEDGSAASKKTQKKAADGNAAK